MSSDPTGQDDELDALLRASLPPREPSAARITAVRAAALVELRCARNAGTRHRAWRAMETASTFALGAAQLAWAIIRFVDRP